MTPDLREKLEQCFSHRAPDGILAAYLFGSRALERDVPESDVDVGVVLDPAARLATAARFEIRLRLIGVRVHVTNPERAREFERDILLRAADLIPFLRRARQAQLERLSEIQRYLDHLAVSPLRGRRGPGPTPWLSERHSP